MRRITPRTAVVVAVWVAVVAACDSADPIAENQSGLPRLGELWQMVQDSTAPDTDGDYLPDDVESLGNAALIVWLNPSYRARAVQGRTR